MPSDKRQPRTIHTILNEVIERVNSDTQRLRILEQSSESHLSRINNLEQAALQSRREAQKISDDLSLRISSLDDRLRSMEGTLKEMVGHMKKLVTETRVKELEGMMELYNPVKSSFVTRDELQRMLKEGPQAKPRKAR